MRKKYVLEVGIAYYLRVQILSVLIKKLVPRHSLLPRIQKKTSSSSLLFFYYCLYELISIINVISI